jgi:hypothetical protein
MFKAFSWDSQHQILYCLRFLYAKEFVSSLHICYPSFGYHLDFKESNFEIISIMLSTLLNLNFTMILWKHSELYFNYIFLKVLISQLPYFYQNH